MRSRPCGHVTTLPWADGVAAPRVDVDLAAIGHNARTLVRRLGDRGVDVTAVTKAVRGAPEVARVLVEAGVAGLGDARIENIERMRLAGIDARMTLIRSPMVSQADRVVLHADASLNTEVAVVAALSAAATRLGRVHGIVLMVELGDLREGIMPVDLEQAARVVVDLPGVTLDGIGTNLACQSGVVPDTTNMAALSRLTASIESACGVALEVVSGGNSASLDWALDTDPIGRVNDLRLGESILLGRQPLDRRPLADLRTDAVTVVAEVIESKVKPAQPWGHVARTSFGPPLQRDGSGVVHQALLAIGEQDVDPAGLVAPAGVQVVGASSDHLVVTSALPLQVGTEVRFEPDYAAMLRAMTSPYVAQHFLTGARAA